MAYAVALVSIMTAVSLLYGVIRVSIVCWLPWYFLHTTGSLQNLLVTLSPGPSHCDNINNRQFLKRLAACPADQNTEQYKHN